MTQIAFDVHQKTSTFAYIDPSTGDEITGRMITSRDEFAKLLGGLPAPWTVALEATRSTPAICAWLRELDCEIHLVDPQKLTGIAETRTAKTDKKDARLILELMQRDYLPEAYLADEHVQAARELTRAHRALVRIGTMLRNLLRAMMARAGKLIEAKDLCGATATEELSQWLEQVAAPYAMIGALYLSLLQQVQLSLAAVDEQIKQATAEVPIAQELMADPGKGVLTTMGMLAEIGDINRFPSAKQLISYAGLAPSVRASGETHHSGRLPRRCNRHLRYWAVTCAQATVRSRKPSRAKQVYLRVKRRHGANTAKIAAAREIIKDVYYTYQRMHQDVKEAA